jgi:hypothetical protein
VQKVPLINEDFITVGDAKGKKGRNPETMKGCKTE